MPSVLKNPGFAGTLDPLSADSSAPRSEGMDSQDHVSIAAQPDGLIEAWVHRQRAHIASRCILAGPPWLRHSPGRGSDAHGAGQACGCSYSSAACLQPCRP